MTMRVTLLVLVCLALPRAAHAQQEEEARQYFDAGKQAAQKGEYGTAIIAFEEAYKRSPRASVVYALAYSCRQQYVIDGDPARLRRAVELFRAYLDMPGNDKRAKAVEYLGELEPQLRKLDASQQAGQPAPEPPPARTTLIVSSPVDGALVSFEGGAEVEAPAVFETTAGRHKLAVSARGYQSTQREAVAVEGQTLSVEVALAELPATLVVRGGAGATVAVDGVPVGRAGDPLSLPAGRHRVTVLRRGRYAWERDLVLERGATLAVDAQLPVTTQRKIARYFLGGGTLLVLAGGGTALTALAAQSDAQAFNARVDAGEMLSEAERLDYGDAIDRRDGWRAATYGLIGVGLAATAAGAILYFIDTPRVETGAPARAAPVITPMAGAGLLGLSWQGRF